MQCLTLRPFPYSFDVTSFPIFLGESDISSSVLTIRKLKSLVYIEHRITVWIHMVLAGSCEEPVSRLRSKEASSNDPRNAG